VVVDQEKVMNLVLHRHLLVVEVELVVIEHQALDPLLYKEQRLNLN
jgi:hypothetical protein